MTTLIDQYRQHVQAKHLIRDPKQEAAIQHLDAFVDRLKVPRKRFLFKPKRQAVRGVYLYGGVGRGKTMMMDMLVEALAGTRVRRVHFHAFMIEVHDRLKALRDSGREDDFIDAVAEGIAKETDVLCFDELHVNDIADAMILGPLFDDLDEHGVSIVTTSNYAPDDLYKGGLQRSRFLPFIERIKAHTDITYLSSPTDYRLRALNQNGVYFHPLNDQTKTRMEALFETLTHHQPAPETVLNVRGRTLPVARAAGDAAWVTFQTLCAEARGAEDYLTLGQNFGTVFIDNVPVMDEAKRNEARRFMTLIDTLYDLKTVVALRADAMPQDLYKGDTHEFEFQRTVSRLLEMQSPDWFSRNRPGMVVQ